MNNQTGIQAYEYRKDMEAYNPLEQYHPKQPMQSRALEFSLCFCNKINTADGHIPQTKKYRIYNNAKKTSIVLVGAEILHYIKETCGTLNVYLVLARLSFFPVECV